MLSGCANSVSDMAVRDRDLPTKPEWAAPVSVKDPEGGEDAREVAARERAGRLQANRIIVKFGNWYAGIRSGYKTKSP